MLDSHFNYLSIYMVKKNKKNDVTESRITNLFCEVVGLIVRKSLQSKTLHRFEKSEDFLDVMPDGYEHGLDICCEFANFRFCQYVRNAKAKNAKEH